MQAIEGIRSYKFLPATARNMIGAPTASRRITVTNASAIRRRLTLPKQRESGGYVSPFANNIGCCTEAVPSFTTLGGGTGTSEALASSAIEVGQECHPTSPSSFLFEPPNTHILFFDEWSIKIPGMASLRVL